MSGDEYETFVLVWQEREITVSYQANWFNTGSWHIELRCTDRLPVTETGYRSHFVQAQFAGHTDISAFVVDWLDNAATDPAWIRYLEDSRQLKLF